MTNATTLEPVKLDCGHMSTPSSVSTGAAIDADGKTLCYQCAADADRARIHQMQAGDAFTAYVRSDHDWPRCTITTWAGVGLGPGRVGPVRRDNFGNRRQHITAMIEGLGFWGWYYLDRGDVVTLRLYKVTGR